MRTKREGDLPGADCLFRGVRDQIFQTLMLPGMLLSARPSTFGNGEEARIYYYMKIAITIIIFIVTFHEDVMQSLLIKEQKFRKYIKSVMSSNTIETLHAAVRFYSDERRKVLIVPISDIEHFDRENCTNQPYYIKRHSNDDEHNSPLSPGEVLCVGSNEDLLNKGRRYKFSKIRRSDALQQLQMKQIETDGTPKQKTKITKKTAQKLGKMKNGQNELKKFLKNRQYLCTKNNSNEDTDLSNVSSPEPSTSYNTHSTSDTDSHSTSDTDSEVEASKNQITKEKLQQSRKIYLSPGSKQEDPDKNEVACTRQSSQLAGTPEELQQREDRNETRGNQNQSLIASPNRPKSAENVNGNTPKRTTRFQQREDRNETRGNQNQSLTTSPNRPKSAENVNGNTPKRTTSIRKRTLYRLKNIAEPSDSDEEYADVYNNRLQPETRESVDNEGRELYDIEGDEIYIGYGRTIQLAFWEFMRHRGPWKFLRELLEILWTKENLVNRCFKKSRITTEIEDRSPRKRFTPTKYKLLRRIFKDYLNEMYGNASKRMKILKDMNKQIGYKIRDLRKLNYEKIKNI